MNNEHKLDKKIIFEDCKVNNNQNISLKDIENKDVMIRTNKCKNDKIINGSVYNNCKNNNIYKNI